MLIRLVKPHKRRGVLYTTGRVLSVPVSAAMILVQDGVAVPVNEAEFAREVRAVH